MARLELIEISDKNSWEKFVLSNNPRSFLQSWNWGETNAAVGHKIKRFGFFRDDTLIGVCQMIFQNAKRGKHFLIPGGPIINWKDRELVDFVFCKIRDEARKSGAWFVRMRPELIDNTENRELVKSVGFRKAPMHLHAENTWVLGIERSDNEILSGMRKNTRYSVRKSLNSNLKFVDAGLGGISILTDLQKETVERLKFVGFSEKLFKAQMQCFEKDDQAKLYVVEYKGKPVVAAIIIFYGDMAYYHHSASTSLDREVPFSYYLQWRVIQEAKKRGIKNYNFWGIAPEGVDRHRFAGVTIFKTGFGGERIDWVPAYDMPISPLYYTTYLFETVRKKTRGL